MIIKLASLVDKKIQVSQQAIGLFKNYRENEIAFVGNYGKIISGKSFWYDKVLDLADFPGNYVPYRWI